MVEDFCKEHNSSETLLAEYRHRLRIGRDENVLGGRSSIFRENCYLASCVSDDGSIVHVDKYNASANRWEPFRKIRLSSERKHFEAIIIWNRILITGGMVAENYVRSVRFFNFSWNQNER